MNLNNYIRDIPDFPKKGIIFKDITPLLKNKDAYNYTIEEFKKRIIIKKIVLIKQTIFLLIKMLTFRHNY